MEPERRQKILLGILAAVVAVYAVSWFRGAPAVEGPRTSNVRTAAGSRGPNAGITAPDVHLEALERPRPQPGGADRNLFRFQAKVVDRPAPSGPPPVEAAADPPPPPQPPPVPPIAMKFIGVMEVPARSLRIATLSDNRGVYYGSEGDIIEGRYRIVRIGTESIEMTQLDGSGRQVIRLSGS